MALDHYGQAGELGVRLAQAQVRTGGLAAAAQTLRPALQRVQASGEIATLRFAGARALRELLAQPWGPHLGAAELQILHRDAAIQALAEPPAEPPPRATGDGPRDGPSPARRWLRWAMPCRGWLGTMQALQPTDCLP